MLSGAPLDEVWATPLAAAAKSSRHKGNRSHERALKAEYKRALAAAQAAAPPPPPPPSPRREACDLFERGGISRELEDAMFRSEPAAFSDQPEMCIERFFDADDDEEPAETHRGTCAAPAAAAAAPAPAAFAAAAPPAPKTHAPELDLAAYALSGVLLILVLDQFVQLGVRRALAQ
jgi:hypothetical protein